MRFERPDKIEKHYVSQKKPYNEKDNIFDVKLYNNVGIYLMEPETKGNFKYISTLLNNGIKPASWSIRISIVKGFWELYFGPHPEAQKLDLNIRELFEGMNLNNVEISGTFNVGIIKTEKKQVVEYITNFLINQFKDIELKIQFSDLNKKYKRKSITNKYIIEHKINNIQKFDNKTLYKYIAMIELLLKNKEIKELTTIKTFYNKLKKEKNLDRKDKLILDDLIEKYINQRDKIQIAIKYLSGKGSKE